MIQITHNMESINFFASSILLHRSKIHQVVFNLMVLMFSCFDLQIDFQIFFYKRDTVWVFFFFHLSFETDQLFRSSRKKHWVSNGIVSIKRDFSAKKSSCVFGNFPCARSNDRDHVPLF